MIKNHQNPDGTYDGVGVMADASGLSRADVVGIWEDAKANSALLKTCSRHDFESTQPGRFGAKHRCAKCGGTVDSSASHWYRLGLEHARV